MSSSNNNNFIRALSPSLDAIVNAVVSSTFAHEHPSDDAHLKMSNELVASLHGRISAAHTVDAVIDCMYPDYRGVIREKVLEFASWADKKENAQASLEKLTKATSAGSVPQRLRVVAPVFQLTKEFKESGLDAFAVVNQAFADAKTSFQDDIVKAALDAKKAEVTFWENKLDVETVSKDLAILVDAEWQRREKSFKIPTIITNAQGNTALGPWQLSPQKIAEKLVAIRATPLFLQQVNRIVELRHRALAKKIEKKAAIEKRMNESLQDIEMKDVASTSAGPTIQSLIDKGLNARLKKLEAKASKKTPKKAVSCLPSSSTSDNTSDFPFTDYVYWDYAQAALLHPQEENSSLACIPQGKVRGHQGQPQAQLQAGESQGRGGFRVREADGQERERPIEEVNAARRSSVYVSPNLLCKIPDEILTLTWDNAISYVLLNSPIRCLLAGLFRKNVHLSTGVSVPLEIQHELSLGLKYMFFKSIDKKLIEQAWSEFQRKLRWRIFFLFKEGLNNPYDPDYAVEREPSSKQPILPPWMEMGFVMGRRYIRNVTSSARLETAVETQQRLPFAPHVDHIFRFLYDHNYVITMTDKNLGLAVSERDWLRENEKLLLEDKRNYRELSYREMNSFMSIKCEEMQELADMTIDHLELSILNLYDYFLSKVTRKGELHTLPNFYGIPKIHKKPVGFRPIIPCHSVVFNPAAKFVSKELKSLVNSSPTIIHGTKDFIIKLSQLRIDTGRKWFFVTGDVVAFYPNVPLQSCINVVCEMYEDWLMKDTGAPGSRKQEQDLLRLKIFKRAIEIGNTQLITHHMGRYFLQLNGLAMGVADSPDLANLWGIHGEKRFLAKHDKRVFFYGRYIDDCFGLMYADSAEEALSFFKKEVTFDGCVIKWAVSDIECQFLDAFLYKESGKLQWKPYVKAGNNRERIPWVSHHPIDVKRSVYIGECSRLAVLCSSKENYLGAIKDLNLLYVMRGYPEKLVMSWCKKNIQERWIKRFESRTNERDENVLVLKTRFDDVWNYFSATELGETITGYWKEWLERARTGNYSGSPSRLFPEYSPEGHDLVDVRPTLFARIVDGDGNEGYTPDLGKIGILGSRWMVSRKRTKNLFDLATKWKNIVFDKLNDDFQQENADIYPRIPQAGSALPGNQSEASDDGPNEEIVLHRRSSSPEMDHSTFGRLSKVYQ